MAVIVVIIISCGLGNGKFCNIGYCVAVIGQNTRKSQTLALYSPISSHGPVGRPRVTI